MRCVHPDATGTPVVAGPPDYPWLWSACCEVHALTSAATRQLLLAKDLIPYDFKAMSISPLAYAFQPDEKVRDGVVRLLGEISIRGRGLAGRSREPMGELIHKGRLLIKRVRALLWFARPALGLAVYTRARARARKASGLLASQRDFAVMQATLEELARKASKSRDRAALVQVSRSLISHSTAGRAEKKALRQTLQKTMEILCRSVVEIKRSAASRRAWSSPSVRLEKAFHATRRAGKKARRTGENVDFHSWRKKAKRLLYQLELMQAGMGRQMACVMKRVEKLQDKLGAYHDGVVVEERLRQMLPLSASARRVLYLIEKRKARLRKKTEKVARRVEPARNKVSRKTRDIPK